MKGEWCYFKSWFSAEYCDKIIETVSTRPPQDAKIGTNEGVKEDNEFRRSSLWFVNQGDPELGFLFDELWKLAIRANQDWFDIHISKLDYYQVAEYDSTYAGEYKTHHDIFYMNGDPYYHRKLSCVIQLSDPKSYEGGDLVFEHVDAYPNPEGIRQQGSVIFFPSFVRHAALPVTAGKRYSIAAWFDGPKWR
jgi:PKHD-type hydroxylase